MNVEKAFQLTRQILIAYAGNLNVARKGSENLSKWMNSKPAIIPLTEVILVKQFCLELKALDSTLNSSIYQASVEALVAMNIKNTPKIFRVANNGNLQSFKFPMFFCFSNPILAYVYITN